MEGIADKVNPAQTGKVNPMDMAMAEKEAVDMRTAALMHGIGRVAQATKLRAIFP